jgi:hypothetical protein
MAASATGGRAGCPKIEVNPKSGAADDIGIDFNRNSPELSKFDGLSGVFKSGNRSYFAGEADSILRHDFQSAALLFSVRPREQRSMN